METDDLKRMRVLWRRMMRYGFRVPNAYLMDVLACVAPARERQEDSIVRERHPSMKLVLIFPALSLVLPFLGRHVLSSSVGTSYFSRAFLSTSGLGCIHTMYPLVHRSLTPAVPTFPPLSAEVVACLDAFFFTTMVLV